MSTTATEDPATRVFTGGGAFHQDLKRRVAAALTPRDIRRGHVRGLVKAATVTAWAVASYLTLILWVHAWWSVALAAMSLGLALAGMAFCIGHDANHGALTGNRRANRILGLSFDLVGASSYVWRFKHNQSHHSFTNIVDADDDIDQMPFARLAPDQARRGYHRYQHLYMWFMYGLFTLRHHLFGDIRGFVSGGKITDTTDLPKPPPLEVAYLIGGKAVFWTWALLIPLILHGWMALVVFVAVSWVLGITLAVVFQLAHCVDIASFTSLERIRREGPVSWAEHQVATTVDFAPRNKLLCWYLGGLNFQVEHHLFPKVCHVHYPKLWGIVRQTCLDHGVQHLTHPTVRSALASHARWLKAMGEAPAPEPTPQPA